MPHPPLSNVSPWQGYENPWKSKIRAPIHPQNPLISSSSVIGFLTAVDDPSWKLTHTMPSSCCPLCLVVRCPSLEPGRVSSMILPKKSRFAVGAFAFLPSSTAAGNSESIPESMAPPARYRACRASAFWRRVYFWYSWSRAWQMA